MTEIHVVLGFAVVALNAAAGVWGAVCWLRFTPSPAFWALARSGQGALILQVLIGGVLLALGQANDGLHYLYGLLPVVVTVIAEQLRILSAEHVLHARGMETAQDVGRLADADQQSVVLQIVRREMGVMALAALAVAALSLRAAFTSGGL